jgi:alkaline phosphatase D
MSSKRPSDRHTPSRRQLLQHGLAALGGLALWPATSTRVLARPRFARDPFSLGVASGYPTPDGVVLWTRLAPEPRSPDGGMPPALVAVDCELARDERFRDVVHRRTEYASPDWAHSVHCEIAGLEPGRDYWYRFTAGDARSPVGRTRTAPKADATPARLRLAVASCQMYEHGWFTAYQQVLADAPDLVVHVGDYIYEKSWGKARVRRHDAPDCYTLEDYRLRHALYRGDPDLQRAHAACPWLLVWDDHEVGNDYAGDLSEEADVRAFTLARRAAAYRAYYEHLPLPRRAVPFGPDMRIHATRRWGSLATLHLLDTRQYRDPQPCPLPGRGGGNGVRVEDCAALADPARSMLGAPQEAWLEAQLRASRSRWNLLTQGVVMTPVNTATLPTVRRQTDDWNGYPAARRRVMEQLQQSRVANPVVLSGDFHAFMAGELHLEPNDPDSKPVATEFVATSVTGEPWPESVVGGFVANSPGLKLATGAARGYLRVDVGAQSLRADLVAMDTVTEPRSGSRVIASFAVEDGKPVLQRA